MSEEPDLPPVPWGEQSTIFRLEIEMGINHLTEVRRLVCAMAGQVLDDAALSARLALTAHELLENALKYSLNTERLVKLDLWISTMHQARVTVQNASSEGLYHLVRERLQQIEEAADPVDSYHRLIRSSLNRTSGSGLGLARIRAEAEMRLSCDYQDGILSVRAETTHADRHGD